MIKRCIECGKELIGKRKKFCSLRCNQKNWRGWYNKEYYKKNRGKIIEKKKEYNAKPEVKKRTKEYLEKNKGRFRVWIRNYNRNKKYSFWKTPQARIEGYIRKLTRLKYPITNQKCFKCGSPAEEHHHITEPIEIDEFEYVCKKCHKEIPRNKILKNELKGGVKDDKRI